MKTLATKEYTTKEVAAIVRKSLTNRYGRKNISVTKGTGTASGWIHATVETKKPHDCFCKANEVYCQRCREQIIGTTEEAKKIVYDAMWESGATFDVYYGDEPEAQANDCFMLQTRLII